MQIKKEINTNSQESTSPPFLQLNQCINLGPKVVTKERVIEVFLACEHYLIHQRSLLRTQISNYYISDASNSPVSPILQTISRLERDCNTLRIGITHFSTLKNLQKTEEACLQYTRELIAHKLTLTSDRYVCAAQIEKDPDTFYQKLLSEELSPVIDIAQRHLRLRAEQKSQRRTADIINMKLSPHSEKGLLGLVIHKEYDPFIALFSLYKEPVERQALIHLAHQIVANKENVLRIGKVSRNHAPIFQWLSSLGDRKEPLPIESVLTPTMTVPLLHKLIDLEGLLRVEIIQVVAPFASEKVIDTLMANSPIWSRVFRNYGLEEKKNETIPFELVAKACEYDPQKATVLLGLSEATTESVEWLLKAWLVGSNDQKALVEALLELPEDIRGMYASTINKMVEALAKHTSSSCNAFVKMLALCQKDAMIEDRPERQQRLKADMAALLPLISWVNMGEDELLAFVLSTYHYQVATRRASAIFRAHVPIVRAIYTLKLPQEQKLYLSALKEWKRGAFSLQMTQKLLVRMVKTAWPQPSVAMSLCMLANLLISSGQKKKPEKPLEEAWQRLSPEWQEILFALCDSCASAHLPSRDVKAVLSIVSEYPYPALARKLATLISKKSGVVIPHMRVIAASAFAISQRDVLGMLGEEMPAKKVGATIGDSLLPNIQALMVAHPSLKEVLMEILEETKKQGRDIDDDPLVIALGNWYTMGLSSYLTSFLPNYWKNNPSQLLNILEFPLLGYLEEAKRAIKHPSRAKRELLLQMMGPSTGEVISAVLALSGLVAIDKKILLALCEQPHSFYHQQLALLAASGDRELVESLDLKGEMPLQHTLVRLIKKGRIVMARAVFSANYKADWMRWLNKYPSHWRVGKEKVVIRAVAKLLAERPSVRESYSDQCAREKYEEVTFSVALARSMITTNGYVLVPTIDQLMGWPGVQTFFAGTDYADYIRRVLTLMAENHNLSDWVVEVSGLDMLSSVTREVVRFVCNLAPQEPIKQRHVLITILSACLVRPRQSPSVGSCGGAREVIYASSSPEGLQRAIRDYTSILERMSLLRKSHHGGEVVMPIPQTYLIPGDSKRVEGHPLVSAMEYLIVSMSVMEDRGLFKNNFRIIFADRGALDTRLSQCYDKVGRAPVKKTDIMNAIQDAVLDNVIEVFDPDIQIPGQTMMGGWLLTDKRRMILDPSEDAWRELYASMVHEATTALAKSKGYILEAQMFIGQVRGEIIRWFMGGDGEVADIAQCSRFAWQERGLVGSPWQQGPGSDPDKVLKSNYSRKKVVPIAQETPASIEDSLGMFLKYCHALPTSIKAACAIDPGTIMPADIPEHSMSVLPEPALRAYANGYTPASLQEHLTNTAATIGQTLISPKEVAVIVKGVIPLLKGEEVDSLRAKMSQHIAGKIPLQRACETVLGHILLARGTADKYQEMSRCIDCIAWNAIVRDLYPTSWLLMGDTNWRGRPHNNAWLSYIPSVLMGSLILCRTDRDGRDAAPLDWDHVGSRWDFYGPVKPTHS